MKAWHELVSVALTGRTRAVPTASLPPDLGAALVGANDDPAAALLDRAAVLTVYRRAATVPRRDIATGAPAPAETEPRVSVAAARRLAGLLTGRTEFLPEWLELCAAGGYRVPEELLPELLERGRGNRMISTRLARVAGERGRWLAALNPDWRAILNHAPVALESDELWETGTRRERAAYLSALRERDPGAARVLLEKEWAAEDPASRAEFLPLLEQGLSADDEPFLEAALDDRRKEVREAAADLLCRLPDSAYARRMAERLARCVSTVDSVLAVRAPETHDAAMGRDGIPAKVAGPQVWLAEIIARTPLAFWHELTGLPAETLVTVPIERHPATVRAGWWSAAVRQRNRDWAKALATGWTPASGPLEPVLEPLDPADRCALATRALAGRLDDEEAVAWIMACPPPWDRALGAAVVEVMGRFAWHCPRGLRTVQQVVPRRLPVDVVPRLEALSRDLPGHVAGLLLRVAEDLRFRHEMAKELR